MQYSHHHRKSLFQESFILESKQVRTRNHPMKMRKGRNIFATIGLFGCSGGAQLVFSSPPPPRCIFSIFPPPVVPPPQTVMRPRRATNRYPLLPPRLERSVISCYQLSCEPSYHHEGVSWHTIFRSKICGPNGKIRHSGSWMQLS